MIKADLIIRCWQCGKEETIVEVLEDCVVDINLDKVCPSCNGGWMMKKELTFERLLIPISSRLPSRRAEIGIHEGMPDDPVSFPR